MKGWSICSGKGWSTSPVFPHSDEQNAKITFEEVLKRKLIDHIETNFEVFKEFNDNKEFRNFFAGTMFKLMQKDFLRFNANR
jgi:type I restriction enzyme R subunit